MCGGEGDRGTDCVCVCVCVIANWNSLSLKQRVY